PGHRGARGRDRAPGRQQHGRQEAIRRARRPDRPGQRAPRRHDGFHGRGRRHLRRPGGAAAAGRGIRRAGRAGARRRRGPDPVGVEPSGVRGGRPVVLLLLVGLTTGLVYGAHTGDVGKALGQLVGSALVQLPAVWVLAGIAVLLFGLVPRWSAAAWGALVGSL